MTSRLVHFSQRNESFFVTQPAQENRLKRTHLHLVRTRIKTVFGPADDGLGCARGALIGLALEIAAGACVYGIWLLFHMAR